MREAQKIIPVIKSKNIIMQAIYFLCGVLVSHAAVFESYAPFGISFAAAVPYENALSASVGSALGYILLQGRGSFRCVSSVVTVYALRWLFSDLPKINRNKLFAPLISSAPLICTGVVIISATGRGSIVMCFVESLLAAVGAYFLKETTLSAGENISTFDQQEIACIIMSGCIFLLSANMITFGKISVGRILAGTAILFCAYYGSAAGGCIGGTAAGVTFGFASGDKHFLALSYSFGGLMAGVFSYVGKFGSAIAFLFCSTVVFLADGITADSTAVFYESVTAIVIFLVIPKEVGGKIAFFVAPHSSDKENENLRRGIIMRLDLASKAIQNINEAVINVSKKLNKIYGNEMDGIFVKTVEETCRRCGMRAFCCKDGEENHIERLKALEPILRNSAKVDESEIRKIFSKRCCKAGEVADNLSDNYESYMNYLSAEARISQIRGVVAGQFSGLAEILSGLKDEFDKYECCDNATAQKVLSALKIRGFLVYECSVMIDTFGRMTIETELEADNIRLLKKMDISEEISKICGRGFMPPVSTAVGNRLRVTFSQKPKYDVQTGSAQHICGNGRLCGDSFNYFKDGQGRFVAIISDGMGTGGRAAVDGGMTVSIISKLVKSGLGFDASLGAVNSALMVKSNDESLATADILTIDLFSGETEIMKAGAPVTFFRNRGKVIRIEPTSLPAGILTDVKLTHDVISLGDDDIVIMVSDGAVAVSDEWIGAMMRDFNGDDIQVLVDDIIDEAMLGSKFSRDDDITVIGVKLHSSFF